MTDLAYAPGGTLDMAGSPGAVAAHLAGLDIVELSGSALEAKVLAEPGIYDTYPVRYQGEPLDRWQTEASRVDNGLAPDQWWEITIVYEDMTYEDAKAQARGELHAYLQAYRHSEFSAAGAVFLSDRERSTTYLTLHAFAQNDATTIDYWIFDKDDQEHHFTTAAEIESFVGKWRNLWFDAQTHTMSTWLAIRDASAPDRTGDFVRQTMDALITANAIPGMTPEQTEALISSTGR